MLIRPSLPVRLLIAAVIWSSLTSATAYGSDPSNDAPALFDWAHLARLPRAASGPFVGVIGESLVVAGGESADGARESRQAGRAFSDEVFALEPDTKQWRNCGKLPAPLAYGAAVFAEEGMICIGGRNAKQCTADVILLTLDPTSKQIKVERLPQLPRPCAAFGAAKLGGIIYVAGGQKTAVDQASGTKNFWMLDLSQAREMSGGRRAGRCSWQELDESWPGAARINPVVVAQRGSLFLIGGTARRCGSGRSPTEASLADAYRFDPNAKRGQRWQPLATPPCPVTGAPAVAFGPNGVLVFGGGRNDHDSILTYDRITDTWVTRGALPNPCSLTSAVWWQNDVIVPGGRECSSHPTARVLRVAVRPWQGKFRTADFGVLVLYLLVLVLIGWYFAKREQNSDDYLLGGRRIPWWAAGLSILATQISSIGFMAVPAKSYATDWVYFASVATWLVVVPIVNSCYIPFFRRLNVTTAYEYLEHRFNLAVRLYGSCVFILFQLGRMSIVLLLPAIALSLVTDISITGCILVMGVLSTLYTVLGGIKAVIWTDVLQAVVLMGGALLAVVVAISSIDGGVSQFIDVVQSDDKFRMVDWDWDIAKAVLWVVLLGQGCARLSELTSDQTVVQRYLTTTDETQAKRALWANVAASVPWAVLVFLLGTTLYVFFKTQPELLNPTLKTDAIVPWFVVEHMPVGVAGLLIAALFAAAMSSLDSSIHSVATTLVTDFYGRLKPSASDHVRLRLARWLTGFLGMMGTGAALLMARYHIESLWDWFLEITGLVVGGLAGLFALGIFTRRANGPGALIGAAIGAVSLYWVKTQTEVHLLLYAAIGMGTCFAGGYVASWLVGPGIRPAKGLTIYTLTHTQD